MNELYFTYPLHQTLTGGQAFNWDYINGTYYGFTSRDVIAIKPLKDKLLWQTYPEKDNFALIEDYLQLNVDYDLINQKIAVDPHINLALKDIGHVRILKQDFEQGLLSFILTSNKNIPAVKQSIRKLSAKYGERLDVEGQKFFLFPKTEVFAELSAEELKKSGIGFRAKYLKNAAEKLSNGEFSDIGQLPPDLARQKLIGLYGVGDKIADCVLVFTLQHYTTTPLDIWGIRVLTDLYGVEPKSNYKTMSEIYRSFFGDYTAFAGQYLFEYLRNKSLSKVPKSKGVQNYLNL
jgi:N-glycosylase/DNA lyase